MYERGGLFVAYTGQWGKRKGAWVRGESVRFVRSLFTLQHHAQPDDDPADQDARGRDGFYSSGRVARRLGLDASTHHRSRGRGTGRAALSLSSSVGRRGRRGSSTGSQGRHGDARSRGGTSSRVRGHGGLSARLSGSTGRDSLGHDPAVVGIGSRGGVSDGGSGSAGSQGSGSSPRGRGDRHDVAITPGSGGGGGSGGSSSLRRRGRSAARFLDRSGGDRG